MLQLIKIFYITKKIYKKILQTTKMMEHPTMINYFILESLYFLIKVDILTSLIFFYFKLFFLKLFEFFIRS